MKKSEVNTLVRDIVDYSNDSIGRTLAELMADDSPVQITREQAEKLIPLLQSTVQDAAFTILASRN